MNWQKYPKIEYYNPKSRTAIYVLPIQGWDVEPWPAFVEIPLRCFEKAKGFKINVEPAHMMSKENHNSFASPSFFILHSSEMDFISTFFI
jgi:hypothetical protein